MDNNKKKPHSVGKVIIDLNESFGALNKNVTNTQKLSNLLQRNSISYTQQLGQAIEALKASSNALRTLNSYESLFHSYAELIKPIKIPTIGISDSLSTFKAFENFYTSRYKSALDQLFKMNDLYSFNVIKSFDTLSHIRQLSIDLQSAISTSHKKIVYATDEKLTLEEKIAALMCTADLLAEYIQENRANLHPGAILEAEKIIENMRIMEYYNQKIYSNDRTTLRVKTFFRYLRNSLANTIDETEKGKYYDTLFDILVKFIKAIDAFMIGYERYRQTISKRFGTVVLNEDYKTLAHFVQTFNQIVSKKQKYNENFIYTVIYLIADAFYCDEYNLAYCFYYLRSNDRPNKQKIARKIENPIKEIQSILTF